MQFTWAVLASNTHHKNLRIVFPIESSASQFRVDAPCCWIWKKGTKNPGRERPRVYCQLCFPRLTGEPRSELAREAVLSLCQLRSICFITISNSSFGLMSPLHRSQCKKWYAKSSGSPGTTCSQLHLIYTISTKSLLPSMWSPGSHSFTQNLKVSLKLLPGWNQLHFPPPPSSFLVLMQHLFSAVVVRILIQRSWGLTTPRHALNTKELLRPWELSYSLVPGKC